eukprot:EC686595.1.p6 GENE.EC686595.1~~EC686595.1.p6  ORF type:complete len:83 (+),score=22.61 EC686595.1:75-323(+)
MCTRHALRSRSSHTLSTPSLLLACDEGERRRKERTQEKPLVGQTVLCVCRVCVCYTHARTHARILVFDVTSSVSCHGSYRRQ